MYCSYSSYYAVALLFRARLKLPSDLTVVSDGGVVGGDTAGRDCGITRLFGSVTQYLHLLFRHTLAVQKPAVFVTSVN